MSVMWLFTDFGFFSVVKSNEEHDKVLVRGRTVEDLERLVLRHGSSLNSTVSDILMTPKNDYCCRLIVPASLWSQAVFEISENIDYDNFKNSVKKKLGHDRANQCASIWCTMRGLQYPRLDMIDDESFQNFDLNEDTVPGYYEDTNEA